MSGSNVQKFSDSIIRQSNKMAKNEIVQSYN